MSAELLPCPDSAGFWWFLPAPNSIHWARSKEWEMVEARELYAGHICLYSCSRDWGGHTLELAKEYLPGQWVKVTPPSAQPPATPAQSEDARMLDWLEEQTKKSPTGISFDFYKEDQVPHYRFMRRFFIGDPRYSLRSAIKAVMEVEAA